MTDTQQPNLQGDRRDTAISVPVFVLWIIAQAALLLVAYADLQLTARDGTGARQWACQLMLVGQIGVSSLLLPTLTASLRCAAVAAAISFPFTQIAAALGPAGPIAGLRASGVLLLWLLALAILHRVGRRLGWVLPVLLVGWVWGSFALWYLLRDFRPNSPAITWLARLSPLLW